MNKQAGTISFNSTWARDGTQGTLINRLKVIKMKSLTISSRAYCL